MNSLSKKLFENGFQTLQEKEDCIFYEKVFEFSPTETHQICVVYDKKERSVKSLDTFIISNSEMKITKAKTPREISSTLDRLLS